MSQDPVNPINDVALDWALRMADPARADWDGFTDWLEADPRHAVAYDRMAAALLDAEDALRAHPDVIAPEPVIVEAEPPRRRPLRWIGGAVAAALVGAVGLGLWSERPQPYVIETAAGEVRRVPLADGSAIMLAGGSRIMLDHADPRRAVMERGEALFQVRHDDRHPFSIDARGLALTDLGTVFDVRLGRRVTRVAVAEGAVMVDPRGAALRLDAGQAVLAEGNRLVRQAVAPEAVGGWRDGRLAYDGAALSDVAEDLARFLGRPVEVRPSVAAQAFRGTIDLNAVRRDPRLLGALLNVAVREDGQGWMLEPRG